MFLDFAMSIAAVTTIRVSADAIRMSADRLIVSENVIRIWAIAHIICFSPSRSFSKLWETVIVVKGVCFIFCVG